MNKHLYLTNKLDYEHDIKMKTLVCEIVLGFLQIESHITVLCFQNEVVDLLLTFTPQQLVLAHEHDHADKQ